MSRFITIEGIDGSGTTTVSKRVAEQLDDANWSTEPTKMWTGKAVRRAFEEESMSPLATFYMFMADRVAHTKTILEPKLDAGVDVISDRGPDSTRAYQYHALDVNDPGPFIEGHLTQSMSPDLTIWLQTDVDTAFERTDGDDDFEEKELQMKVQDRYKLLWQSRPRIKRVDATQHLEDVVADTLDIINDTE